MRYRATFILLQIIVLGIVLQAPAQNAQKLDDAAIAGWRSDLKFLSTELPRVHKNAFHDVSRERFHSAITDLDRKIPGLTRRQVALEFQRIVSMVGDGHTWLLPIFAPSFEFHALPIKVYVFKEGVFVISASPSYKDLVGARIVSIGGKPVDEVITTLTPYIPHENEMGVKSFAPIMLVSPEVLNALGVIPRNDRAMFELEKQGSMFSKEVALDPGNNAVRGVHAKVPGDWIDARPAQPVPVYARNPDAGFWWEYLADEKVLYVKLDQVLDKQDKTLAQFMNEVKAAAKANPVEKLVIDLRNNGGGNNGLAPTVVRAIVQLESLDQPGKFFVIIGRQTFSAAQNLTNGLETFTNATFVGEPTSSHVNMYGDGVRFTLPYSGLQVQASSLWWQNMSERDTRKWTAPDIAAEPAFADYARGTDAAMSAIMSSTPQKTIRQIAEESLMSGGFEAFRERIIAFRKDPVNVYRDIEADLNRIGYYLMGRKQLDLASKVFELNVELYPGSFNVYDSLAECYMNQGRNDLAIKNYKRTLELNPNNPNAVEQLKKLGAKPQDR